MSDIEFLPFNSTKLQQAVLDAWNETLEAVKSESRYPEPRITTLDMPQVIAAAVHTKLATLASELNAASSRLATKLPAEILATILLHLAKPQERATAALISKDWLEAFRHSPHIWRETSCYGSNESALAMDQVLKLSGQTTVDLNVTFSGANEDTLTTTLEETIPRCRRLYIWFTSEYGGWPQVDRLTNALGTTAPQLQSVWLNDPSNNFFSVESFENVELFGGRADCLTCFQFDGNIGVLHDADLSALHAVRTVSLWQRGPMALHHLELLFRIFPQVVYLRVQVEECEETEGESPTPCTPPASLRSLDIMADTTDSNLLPFLDWVKWQDFFRVGLETEGHTYTPDQLLSFFSSTPPTGSDRAKHEPLHTAWIDWYDEATSLDIGISIYMTGSDTPPHVLLPKNFHGDVPTMTVPERTVYKIRSSVPSSLFVNITTLYVQELVFDPEALPDSLPPFPTVVDLNIVLMNSHFMKNDLGVSPFMFHGRDVIEIDDTPTELSVRRYYFARLQSLSITSGYDEPSQGEYHPTFTPVMIREFVEQHLQYDAPLLRQLALYGVDLHVEDGQRGVLEFQQMLQLAEDVEFDEQTLSWAINFDSFRAHMNAQ